MADILIIAVIAVIAVYCIHREVSDARKGIRCDCGNDCSHCRIQCRSNEKYYGMSGNGKGSHMA